MRILIYGLNYQPELTGIGKYTGEMSSWLATRGHDVRVVTAPPYYPSWRIRDDYQNAYRVQRAEGKATVYRCPLYVPAKPNGVNRTVHLASFMFSSLPVLLRQVFWQPHVVFTVEPTLFAAPVALLAAAAAGATSWLHVQDFEVDAAFDLGLLPAKGPVHDLALVLEKPIMRTFSRVSSISSKMVERIHTKGVPSARTVLFPNWVNVDEIYPQLAGAPNSFRKELGLENKFILLYSGNMGAKQGLDLLAPLAQDFAPGGPDADSRVHFIFCGDGAYRAKLESRVAHLPNVTMLPLQPYHRLNDLLNAADVHLLPQRAGAADLVMPSKLTGMLSSGRPVIATAEPDTQVGHIIGGNGSHEACGIIVPSDDETVLHAAVRTLVNDSSLRCRLGKNARRYAVDHLGREQVLNRFESALQELV